MNIIRSIYRPHPAHLYLEPFFGCNYSCFFCFYRPGVRHKPVPLSRAVFEKLKPVIDGVNHIHITGLGEPFLNPHLTDYMEFFREKNKPYYINTNGSLVRDEHLKIMATSPCELSFSLDAGDDTTYREVRHPHHWDTVMATLAKIRTIKKDLGSPYPHVYVHFNINQLNVKSLAKLPNLCLEMGIEAVRLSWTVLPPSHAHLSVFRHQNDVEHILQTVTNQLHAAGVPVASSALFDVRKHKCWNLTAFAFVGANGTVAACCSRWIGIGSLLENSFKDIWNGMPHRKIGFGVFNGKPEAVCKTCRLIRPIDYQRDETSFIRREDTQAILQDEKTKQMQKLPSLDGLNSEFQRGVAALFNKNGEQAADIFLALEKRFPDFYEIKQNLAVAYQYLGNTEKRLDLERQIKAMPHIERRG
jgi:wyosine [tRNA(Phe)-imidazoG37] synthetase (radical SAM superfamily)